jgi:hypothetical protein
MSRNSTTGAEPGTKSNLKLLSFGKFARTRHNNRRITDGTDAGGSQAVSQLHILTHVMEKISHDANGRLRGVVKRPCEVFDAIGGTGTGGSVEVDLAMS